MTAITPGSVALITGGTGGLGRALAALLRRQGVTVVLADLDSLRARQTAADLGAAFLPLDVTDRAANAAVVAQVEADHGRLDVAFLNAGIAGSGQQALDVDELLHVVDVDLFGVVYGAEAALPALRRAGGGSIVVTASLAGLAPHATEPGYSIAKAGAIAFVRSLAPRLVDDGITVSAVCPGFADTAIIDPLREAFAAVDFPVLSADEVAQALLGAWTARQPGAAYVVQPGVGAVPFRFPGVPSAKTADGRTATLPGRLRPPARS
ncbi:SDR family oxidoreductase [Modestobacter roseus]|uniref:NADP-dependent 3-hydroxy acid dehydrogenase YdfG n=1 Tax=Modestobacter roseus TaxID=1181884 RepID=A0A562IQ83_9ACTN|nr:SDR family NAD(P)-dependent oxidoreductase [Modestobacter roseus]MQA35699.1 SDR family NAD(P)-dependent oxidoreductase [Modestobacter roseus]TWH72883.1 NADP-dependent 3-hydroxy acid dehydrogenase YdfG [Modestobacter roseus]